MDFCNDDLLGLVIGLSVACGVLAIILTALVILLCRYKSLISYQTHRILELEQQQAIGNGNHTQIGSVPCRLKKRRNTQRSESGVYDMSSSGRRSTVSAISRTSEAGTNTKKTTVYGNIEAEDEIVLCKALCSYYNDQTVISEINSPGKNAREIVTCEDIAIEGLNEDEVNIASQDNHGFESDSHGHSLAGRKLRKSTTAVKRVLNMIRKDSDRQWKLGSRPDSLELLRPAACSKKCINIGSLGGEIILPGGVKLIVPPDALTENIDITIGVTWEKKHLPQLTREQCLLSSIIYCEPTGLQFKKSATLILPHCAINVNSEWNISILSSQTSVHESTKWNSQQIGDYDSRFIDKKNVELHVNHFTMYAIIGESKVGLQAAKGVKMIAFASSIQRNKLHPIRVYCVNNYSHDEMEFVRRGEREMQGHLLHAPVPLIVHDDSQNVAVNIDGINDGWKCIGQSQQEMDFEAIWHSLTPNCKFTLKPSGSSVSELICDILSWQIGRETRKNKICVAEDVSKSPAISPISNNTDTPTGTYTVFREPLRWQIVTLLDAHNALGNDWRLLAEEMKLAADKIIWLENQESPTKHLLRFWEDGNYGCLKSFLAAMVKLERFDVADVVEKLEGPVYLETLPNHKCELKC